MDYYYRLKSNNSKVWLPVSKAKTRLELTAQVGYFDFIGLDGEAYTVLDVVATDIKDLNGWASLVMAVLVCALLFPYQWYFGIYGFCFAFILMQLRSVTINCDVVQFNNSFFKIHR